MEQGQLMTGQALRIEDTTSLKLFSFVLARRNFKCIGIAVVIVEAKDAKHNKFLPLEFH